MKAAQSTGLTLVELMVVVVVLAITLAVAAPSFLDMLERRRVQAIATEISTDLAYARAESGVRPQAPTIQFQQDTSTSCYSMYFYSGLASCNCFTLPNACNMLELKTMRLPRSSNISFFPSSPAFTPDLLNPYPTLAFNPPQMMATPANFVVTVHGGRGATLRVGMMDPSANSTGRIKICTPDNSMPGVPACS